MSITIDIEGESGVRVSDADVTVESGDTLTFTVDGVARVGRELLGQFAGSRLTPDEIAFSADDDIVEIDLAEEAALRLDAVDVGVEMLDEAKTNPAELTDGVGANPSDVADRAATEASDAVDAAGRISFTAEGEIEDVPEDAAERIAGTDATPHSITFSIDNPVESDGGEPGEPLASIELFGVRIAIRADGTIVVTASTGEMDVGPL